MSVGRAARRASACFLRAPRARRVVSLALAVVFAVATVGCGNAEVEPLPVLARVGPWPVISQPIAHRGRLWFANSAKGALGGNHNSADLHSFDPATGELRYERPLFSQDAGAPAVAGGLLYWPFEDSRFASERGEFLVGDGERWRLGAIATARIFHTSVMAAAGGRLFAGSAAFHAQLQASEDGGRTWRQLYDSPRRGRMSRIVELVPVGDLVFARQIGQDGDALLVVAGDRVAPVPDWPQGRPMVGLTRLGDALLGAVVEGDAVALWRSDGTRSERIAAPRRTWRVVDLAADADGLWALTADEAGGALWRSADGARWERTHAIAAGEPRELATDDGWVYVLGAGDDGAGRLWGVRGAGAAAEPSRPEPAPLPPLARRDPPPAIDWQVAGARLDRLLDDPASRSGPRAPLRETILELALADPPPELFASRLARPMPAANVELGTTTFRAPADQLGRWLLLWGMALAGRGRVPVEWLAEPWTETPRTSEKYFAAAPAAMFVAGLVGQDDRDTLAALVERIERRDDPAWLRGDAVGALTVLTGERFGHDVAAWRGWWERAGPSRAGGLPVRP